MSRGAQKRLDLLKRRFELNCGDKAVRLRQALTRLTADAADAAALARVASIAHRAAGAGALFGYVQVTELASAVEKAVARQSKAAACGEELITCITTLAELLETVAGEGGSARVMRKPRPVRAASSYRARARAAAGLVIFSSCLIAEEMYCGFCCT